MPSWRRIANATARFTAILACVMVTAVGVPVGPASADPSVDEVEDRVHNLNEKVDRAVEEYNQARIRLDDAKARVRQVRTSLTRQQARMERLQERRGTVAAAAYRTGGFGNVAAVLAAKNPQEFIDRAAMLNMLARGRSIQLREYEAALARSKHREEAAQRAVRKQKRLESQLQRQKDKVEEKLDKQEELLAEMTVPVSSGDVPTGGTYTGPATGSARSALEFAYAQLGKPYAWGAAGPDAYDCSGLTMAAWAAGGVSLPHSSQMQYSAGPHVAKSDLQPGDLVFFGSPIHHVGLYAGGGEMVHAVNSGTPVQVDSITSGYWASEYVGAVRP